MQFIEHIIEPTKLLLTWRSPDEQQRTRFIIGELNRVGDEISLTYLNNTADFANAVQMGFSSYPAFQDTAIAHHNVINTFMRRLPPRSRGDFSQYLEGLRLKPDAQLSDFALLGYSGAKLPADGFSLIHPFENVNTACELFIEATGYSQMVKDSNINAGDAVAFTLEQNDDVHEEAILISVHDKPVGYITRALIPTFKQWLIDKRISGAWVEKTNGTQTKPTLYLLVKISAAHAKI